MAFTRPKAAQIDFDVTNISDPLIRLNSAETGSADKDVGIVIERGDDTNVAIIYDESADQFVLVNTTETGTTSGNVTIASYAGLQANGIVYGSLNDGTTTLTSTVAELNYVDGVTSAIQTQLDAKLALTGGAMTGAITTNSTFDGRDVATDGTKLDTIETNADVTDATNVTAAGALMDSEVTNLAQVKAFDSSDYATAAQGTKADAALPKAGGTMTGAIAMGTSKITGMGDPTANQDAATKAYVDSQVSSVPTGDITSVVAGAGLTGGATSGDATLNVVGGTGITANANDIAIDATVATLTGTQTLTNKTITAPVLTGSSSAAGSILFKEDTDNGTNAVTLIGPAATADVTITLPASAGTVALTSDIASAGISSGNVATFGSGAVDDDFLRINGTEIEGRSASEVLSDIGGQAALTFGISNTNAVKIDSASVADDEYARFTANGLESRSTAEVLSDIGGQAALTFGISNTNAVKVDSASVADDEYARFTANGLESRSVSEVASDIGAVTLTGTATLTNKSLTDAVLIPTATTAGKLLFKEGTNNGTNAVTLIGPASTADVTITLPAATDTLVGKATTDTLTNKSIDSDNNTITNIVNADIKSSAAIAFSKMENLTNARALVSDGNGDVSVSAVTATEIGYLDGVSSAIQTQLDAKAPLAAPGFTGTATGVNLTLSGDLTVNGTTTTVATTNTVISDNLIELNNGAGSNANDSGIVIERGSTGDNAFIGWDESADKFIVGTTTATGASTGNLTITTGTLVANIEGNATTATTLATARNIAGQSFDGSAAITIASTDLSDTSNLVRNNQNNTITSTTAGSSAAPEFELFRDITGADSNYIGQIKFSADNDADQKTVFAKITGKIGDASDGTEDGIIEIAHIKAGSQNINVRMTSTEFKILNGTDFDIETHDGSSAGLRLNNTLVTATAAELNILDGVTATASELNIIDGDTSATSTTLADADRLVVNDAGTMKQVALTDFETYFETALDTLSNVTSVGTLNGLTIASTQTIDMGANRVTSVADPVGNQDAATKAYVDANAGSGGGASGFTQSTTTTAPGSDGNFDLSFNVAQDTQEAPFEAGGSDPFGVSLGEVYDQMEPVGSTSVVDLGAFT